MRQNINSNLQIGFFTLFFLFECQIHHIWWLFKEAIIVRLFPKLKEKLKIATTTIDTEFRILDALVEGNTLSTWILNHMSNNQVSLANLPLSIVVVVWVYFCNTLSTLRVNRSFFFSLSWILAWPRFVATISILILHGAGVVSYIVVKV